MFLRGFPSPKWLRRMRDTQKVSLEFYRRHLDFPAFAPLGSRDLYTSPPLPSSYARVFQLMIPTICARNVDHFIHEPQDLQMARERESEGMAKYFRALRNEGMLSDSMVRKCLILTKQTYVLEQIVTIEVTPADERGNWHAAVWLDNGKDLSQSVQGPWSPLPGTKAWETYFYPVVVTKETGLSTSFSSYKTPMGTPSQRVRSQNTVQLGHRTEEDWEAAQNACHLPSAYAAHLDKEIASQDALYSLSEIFRFAASAEAQFLNLLHKCIEKELSFIGAQEVGHRDSVSLINLSYIKAHLTAHAQSLTEATTVLQNRHSLDWPRIDTSQDVRLAALADKSAALLLADFEFLIGRAQVLSRECEQGMATLANNSVLQESRRSVDMAVKVQRLTIIGTIFIPLSFACSVWGMNIEEMGSGPRPIWMWVMTAVPVLLFTYLVYSWSSLVNIWRKRKERAKQVVV